MKVTKLYQFYMPGPGPEAGPKTRITWVDDEGQVHTSVVNGTIYDPLEAERMIRPEAYE